MNVLSLFDGMSCGRIALERLGIKVDNYYASEIDKYAMKVSEANYPDIIQLGDILNWQDWDIDWESFDLVTGGFPCQSWSVAGKGLGDKDDRGKLFWVMLDVMKKVMDNNPSAYYLMENVRMKKEFEEYITMHTENALPNVNKYMINSALVSAQNRVRYYWTNILGIEQPKQRGIVLRDILETKPNNYTLMSNKFAKRQEGRKCLVDMNKEKAASLSAMEYVKNGRQGDYLACNNFGEPKVLAGAFRGRYQYNGSIKQNLELRQGGKTNALTTAQKDNVVTETIQVDKDKRQLTIKEATKKGYTIIEDGDCFDMTFPKSKTRRGRNMKDKSNCLTAANYDYMRYEHTDEDKEVYWRKLTPTECMRLQTVQDDYLMPVSNSQKYKLLGNGWTIEVIAHILKKIKEDI